MFEDFEIATGGKQKRAADGSSGGDSFSMKKEWKQRSTVEVPLIASEDYIFDKLVEAHAVEGAEQRSGSNDLEGEVLGNYFDLIRVDPEEEKAAEFR